MALAISLVWQLCDVPFDTEVVCDGKRVLAAVKKAPTVADVDVMTKMMVKTRHDR